MPAPPPPLPPASPPHSHGARVAAVIDHTLLKPEATRDDIQALCAEARELGFAAVCVNPVWVPLSHAALVGSSVKVATVIGFPFGANEPEIKAAESALAIDEGASELDMVAALGHIRSGDWVHVSRDIAAVVAAAAGRPVKVIIETAILDAAQIVRASTIARDAGAAFVKTSTGFHAAGGATVDAVSTIRRAVGPDVGVKASGGIRDCSTALRMLAAGATRLGTSSGVRIVRCLGSDPAALDVLVLDAGEHATRCSTIPAASVAGRSASESKTY